MQLHIVRHGQTHWNAEQRIQGQLETELNDIGKQQARDRGIDFADMTLKAAYSSSSIRTRQTMQLLLGERQDPVTLRDDLREINLGIWQGELWSDIQKAHPEMVEAHRTASPLFEVEGAEKSHELQERGVSAIEAIIEKHSDADITDHILVVSHGAIMKTILAHYANVQLSHLQHLPSLPNCAHCTLEISGDMRNVLTVSGEPITTTAWSQTGHFDIRNEAQPSEAP